MRSVSMSQIVIAKKKQCFPISKKKDLRSILPKPKLGILDEKAKEQLFEYVNSLNKK